MKSIKYLLLGLAVGLLSTSCEKDDPELNWKPADYSKAFVQVYDMRLVKNSSVNNTEYLTINGNEIQYDHNAVISPYNFAPSYVVGSSYQVEPGYCTVKMESEDSEPVKDPVTGETLRTADGSSDSLRYINRRTIYEGTTEVELSAGKVYQVIVWDDVAAPKVHEYGTPPVYTDVDSLGNTRYASFRFYNYFFDSEGEPTKARLYFDVRKKSWGEVIGSYPENGLAFGEATDYIDYYCDPSQTLNLYNDVYMRQDVRAVYPDGTEKILIQNDYWTTRPGRSYHYFYVGDLAGDVYRKTTCVRFGAK